jgi:2,3-dihydroxybenzoate decarboxylase
VHAGGQDMHERLLDIGAGRIAHMDATGIAMQVLALTAPGVQVFDAITAAALAKQANDRLAEAVQNYPTRFAGLAAIAPQHPESAAREIDRAIRSLNMKGVIINSHTMGEYLDDSKYWAIFEAAESLGAPIYLHPRDPSPAMVKPYLDYELYSAGWGFAAEAGLHAMRLIMCGVFDRFPKLKIILGHMGEAIPFWLQRIDNRYLLLVQTGVLNKMPRLPSEYFKDNFVVTTSGMMHHGVLKFVLEVLGPERVLFAADYPYELIEEAVTFMDTAPLSEDDRAKIYEQNATKLFSL